MDEKLIAKITAAVISWAKKSLDTDEIIVGSAAEDDIEDEEATRYLVDFAVRSVGHWSIAEVWVFDGKILSVNDLGEGLPLEDAGWPWTAEETS
jgi:hypothetical protein